MDFEAAGRAASLHKVSVVSTVPLLRPTASCKAVARGEAVGLAGEGVAQPWQQILINILPDAEVIHRNLTTPVIITVVVAAQ